MQVLDDTVPLSPKELLALRPKEAALLEVLRRLFIALEVDQAAAPNRKATINEAHYEAFLMARNIYLKLRDLTP